MKCQECDQAATHHVTEVMAGEFVEYHVCEKHLADVDTLEAANPKEPTEGFGAFFSDATLRAALNDDDAQEKMAAHQLPALCLALLDLKPEVKVFAVYCLMRLGPNAGSASGALCDALQDADERVRKAARIALKYIESGQRGPWFV